jgi:hypothetical protein
MISLQNSANQKFNTFASSRNSGKWQSQMKLQDHATIHNIGPDSNGELENWKKATENPCMTQTLELSTKYLPKATSKVEL